MQQQFLIFLTFFSVLFNLREEAQQECAPLQLPAANPSQSSACAQLLAYLHDKTALFGSLTSFTPNDGVSTSLPPPPLNLRTTQHRRFRQLTL